MIQKVKKPAPNGRKQQASKHHLPADRDDNASVNPIGEWSSRDPETDSQIKVFASRRIIQQKSELLCGAYQFELCADGYTEQDLDYILTEVTSTGSYRPFETLRPTIGPSVILHLAINLVNETCRLSCFDQHGSTYKSAWIWRNDGVIYAGICEENETMIIEIVLADHRVRTFHSGLDLITFIRRFNAMDDTEMQTALKEVRRSLVQNIMTESIKYEDY